MTSTRSASGTVASRGSRSPRARRPPCCRSRRSSRPGTSSAREAPPPRGGRREVARPRPGPTTRRFISSGKGCRRSPVRSPASTWPTGIRAVKGRERGRHGGRRVALDEEPVRRLAREHAVERRRGPARRARSSVWSGRMRSRSTSGRRSRRARAPGRASRGAARSRRRRTRASGLLAEAADDRRHLDGLGARADDDEELHESLTVRQGSARQPPARSAAGGPRTHCTGLARRARGGKSRPPGAAESKLELSSHDPGSLRVPRAANGSSSSTASPTPAAKKSTARSAAASSACATSPSSCGRSSTR